MKLNKQEQYLPKLKFSNNSGNWTFKLLGDFKNDNRKILKAGPFGSALKKEDYVNSGYKVYGQEQVIKDDPFFGDYFISEEKFQRLSSCEVKPGDLLISLVGTFGKILLIPENAMKGIINPRLLRISIPRDQIDSRFLKNYLETEKVISLLKARSQGGTMGILNADIVGSIPILFPPLPDQQKIAFFLSAIDERIQQLTRKKELLEQYKKGVMQQLFSGKLRFKGFNGAWHSNTLGECISLISGFGFHSELFAESGKVLITPKNFTKVGKAYFDTRNTKYTCEKVDPRFICKPGDLLVLLTDLTPSCELLGKPVLLREEDGAVLLNQRIVKIVVDEKKVSKIFLSVFFQTEKYHRHIKETSTGTTVRHSSNKVLLSLKLSIPSLAEQKRIADYIINIDNKVEAVTTQIAQTQAFKKGLLQQMFV